MDRTGPLGKGSSINTPRVQFWGVFACVCRSVNMIHSQPVPLISNPAQTWFCKYRELETRRISISSFWPLFREIIRLVMQPLVPGSGICCKCKCKKCTLHAETLQISLKKRGMLQSSHLPHSLVHAWKPVCVCAASRVQSAHMPNS